jgi:rhamnose transport system permease protein
MNRLSALRSWEGLLLVILIVAVAASVLQSPYYLTVQNQVNLFHLSIEKVLIVLPMTLLIINGEIDLSVASIMGLAACLLAILFHTGVPMPLAMLAAVGAGALAGILNGYCVAHLGLPSLAVTLAGLIGFRGIGRILVEDRAYGGFPKWFEALGQKSAVGPLTLPILAFLVLFVVTAIFLQRSGKGRIVTIMGNGLAVARYSGVRVKQVKLWLFVFSGAVSALAGVVYAARLGSVRGDMALGFELDIITVVLLGGVSIFGGTGSMVGVGLSILLILNIRNGMGLANVTANVQSSVIGALLILSVLLPNVISRIITNRKGRET